MKNRMSTDGSSRDTGGPMLNGSSRDTGGPMAVDVTTVIESVEAVVIPAVKRRPPNPRS